MRIKKGFLEITETKREREGPNASKAYPIPAATVMSPLLLLRGRTFWAQEDKAASEEVDNTALTCSLLLGHTHIM